MPNGIHMDAHRIYDLTVFTCSNVFLNMLRVPRYLNPALPWLFSDKRKLMSCCCVARDLTKKWSYGLHNPATRAGNRAIAPSPIYWGPHCAITFLSLGPAPEKNSGSSGSDDTMHQRLWVSHCASAVPKNLPLKRQHSQHTPTGAFNYG